MKAMKNLSIISIAHALVSVGYAREMFIRKDENSGDIHISSVENPKEETWVMPPPPPLPKLPEIMNPKLYAIYDRRDELFCEIKKSSKKNSDPSRPPKILGKPHKKFSGKFTQRR